MTYLSLNIHALKAANKSASVESTRPYLHGVCVTVTAETITYVATNGHILFAYQEPARHTSTEPMLGEWIVPSTVIAKMKCPKYNSRRALKDDPGYARCTVVQNITGHWSSQFGDDCHVFEMIDGTYPDWRRTIPMTTDASAPVHNYNPDYLVALKRAGEIMGEHNGFAVSYNGQSAALVGYSNVEGAIAVIMPYRCEPAPKTCPEWVHARTKTAEAA